MDTTESFVHWLLESDRDEANSYRASLREYFDDCLTKQQEHSLRHAVDRAYNDLCNRLEKDWSDWWDVTQNAMPDAVWYVVEEIAPDMEEVANVLLDTWGVEDDE